MIAVAAVVLAIALVVVGGVALWGALTSNPAKPGGAASSSADPSAASGSLPSSKPKPTANSTSTPDALVVRCRATKCGVFISSNPDNDVLFNGILSQGDERSADEPRMTLVVSDGSSVDVYINGKLQQKGPAGKKKYFTIVKS